MAHNTWLRSLPCRLRSTSRRYVLCTAHHPHQKGSSGDGGATGAGDAGGAVGATGDGWLVVTTGAAGWFAAGVGSCVGAGGAVVAVPASDGRTWSTWLRSWPWYSRMLTFTRQVRPTRVAATVASGGLAAKNA